MRSTTVIAVACLCILLCAGCSTTESGAPPEATTLKSGETSVGATMPANDPGLSRLDASGRTPAQAVREVLEAENAHDWERLYSLYMNPAADFDRARADWEQQDPDYDEMQAVETRVFREGHAFVRVIRSGWINTPDGVRHGIDDWPGTWMKVEQVDGVWRVVWLGGQ